MTEKPLEEEVAELELELPFQRLPPYTLTCELLTRLIADWRARGEQIAELESLNGITQGTFAELYALRDLVAARAKKEPT